MLKMKRLFRRKHTNPTASEGPRQPPVREFEHYQETPGNEVHIVPGTELCNICYNIVVVADQWRANKNPGETIQLPFHSSIESLLAAWEQSCFICRRVSYSKQYVDHNVTKQMYQCQLEAIKENCCRLNILPLDSNEIRRVYDLISISSSTIEMRRASLRSSSTGNDEVVRLAEHWLSNCLDPSDRNSHKACQKNNPPKYYPSRLLDISGELIKLVDGSDIPRSEPYATLSHCWGSVEFVVLNTDNLRAFQAGVSLSTFPCTFQHVMSFARKLNISFIWIDCYCIIQDGEVANGASDKLFEIAQMKYVYTHSVLNFGASCSRNPFDGCIVNRYPPQLSSTTLTLDDKVSWMISDGYFNVLEDQFYRSPLFKRGWVMQERWLCSRMLHFTDTQLCGNVRRSD